MPQILSSLYLREPPAFCTQWQCPELKLAINKWQSLSAIFTGSAVVLSYLFTGSHDSVLYTGNVKERLAHKLTMEVVPIYLYLGSIDRGYSQHAWAYCRRVLLLLSNPYDCEDEQEKDATIFTLGNTLRIAVKGNKDKTKCNSTVVISIHKLVKAIISIPFKPVPLSFTIKRIPKYRFCSAYSMFTDFLITKFWPENFVASLC